MAESDGGGGMKRLNEGSGCRCLRCGAKGWDGRHVECVGRGIDTAAVFGEQER